METTKERCLKMLVDNGMFPKQAEAVLEQAKPRIEVDGYRMTWDRPASEYPDALYASMGIILFDEAVKWIDEHEPNAWFRPVFVL